MSSPVKPEISIKEIQDDVVRHNFELLKEYFENQNQLQDFVHLVISIDSAQTNVKIRHGLGFVPRDILRTRKTGSGNITFNRSLFTDQLLDITTTGAVEFRGYFGRYIRDDAVETDLTAETF